MKLKKTKILHIIDSLDIGGAQSALLQIVTHCNPLYYSSEVAVMHGYGKFSAIFEERGIPVHYLSPKKFPPYYLINFFFFSKKILISSIFIFLVLIG